MVTKLIKLIRIAHLSSYFCIMKQKIFFLSFAIFLLLGTGMSAQTSPVKEFILHNGLTVWVAEDHTQPKVFGAVVVRAGGKDCPGTGIAHYFEHIMFKGTDRIANPHSEFAGEWSFGYCSRYGHQYADTQFV